MKFKSTIIEILERTKDVKSFRVEKVEGFDYYPGQYILVSVPIGSVFLTKPLSISSSPTEGFIEVTKRLTGHEFSNAMSELRAKDEIYLDGPRGNFTFKGEHKKVGMLCGGIGITPLMSMIKYCTHLRIQSDIILLYGNRSEDNIPFFEELGQMANYNVNFKVFHVLSRPGNGWSGRTGHVDSEMVAECIPDYLERVFYVSGPPPLVRDCHDHLIRLGLPEEKIKTENFIGY